MIDENLLEEAVDCIGARTKNEAIEAGLRDLKASTCPLIARSVGNRSALEAP